MTTSPNTPDAPNARALIEEVCAQIRPIDAAVVARAQARWDRRAKPPGSLGRIETLGATVAGITGDVIPLPITSSAIAVFAGDHGVAASGASAWPSEVTGLMVATMAAGTAAINAFARTVDASVVLVDVGVARDLDALTGVLPAKVRPGTGDIGVESAMTVDEAAAAMAVGIGVARDLIATGADLLVAGDMGIGNTTPSSALIAHFTGGDSASLTGIGAGLAPDALGPKRAAVAAAVQRVAAIDDPLVVVADIGGLEIAAMAGFALAAVAGQVPFVVDGVVAIAAVCVAEALAPGTATRVIAGHRSTEPAATAALEHLGLVPVLDLELRLGEGTGACLAIPIVRAAVAALGEMAELPITE